MDGWARRPALQQSNNPFIHQSIPKLVSAAGLAPAITRSQAEHAAPTLRADGGSEGTRTLSLPADNGLLSLVELRIRKNGLPSVALSRLQAALLRADATEGILRSDPLGFGAKDGGRCW